MFEVLGLAATHGNELWAEEVNADGGICGRDIVLDIQDNGYKADNAIPIYETQKVENLGYMQLIGSPILAALKQKLITDKVTAIAVTTAPGGMASIAVQNVAQGMNVPLIGSNPGVLDDTADRRDGHRRTGEPLAPSTSRRRARRRRVRASSCRPTPRSRTAS